jgi:hypothetical protein
MTKIYLNIPIDINIYSFDTYISFTVKDYTRRFTIYFTTNSVNYLVTINKTQFIKFNKSKNLLN